MITLKTDTLIATGWGAEWFYLAQDRRQKNVSVNTANSVCGRKD
jgi:hypothetical protein